MKYTFLTKTSFLALCAVLMTPCYLLAGGGDEEGDKGDGRPGKTLPVAGVSAPAIVVEGAEQDVPAAVASVPGVVDDQNAAPPPYAAVAAMASGDPEKATKSDDEDDDDEEVRALKAQLKAQERATERAKVLAVKKASLLQRIAQLKQEAEDATQAAIAALEGPQAPAAEVEDAEVQRLGAVVDERRAEIAVLENEVDQLDGAGPASAPQKTREERQWEKFSDKWAARKAARQAEGRKDLSDAQKVKRETQRVVKQVENFVKNPFGKKKRK